MAIFDLYSKRKADREKKTADVFVYDAVPEQVRVQVLQIIEELFEIPDNEYSKYYKAISEIYRFIVETFRREYGVHSRRER